MDGKQLSGIRKTSLPITLRPTTASTMANNIPLEDMTDSAVKRSWKNGCDVVDGATTVVPKQSGRNVFFRVVSRDTDFVSNLGHTIQTGNAELLQGSQTK